MYTRDEDYDDIDAFFCHRTKNILPQFIQSTYYPNYANFKLCKVSAVIVSRQLIIVGNFIPLTLLPRGLINKIINKTKM